MPAAPLLLQFPRLAAHLPSPHIGPSLPLPPSCLQIKSTVLLMPSGSDRITSAPLQPLQPLQSDKALEDEEIKALLATRCAACPAGLPFVPLSTLP